MCVLITNREVDEVRRIIGIVAAKLYRLFGSDRNTRIAQGLIVLLLGVTLMGTVMYALFDVARVVRPVAHIERFFGIEQSRGGTPAPGATRPDGRQ
jgi:hypothetical protein